MTLYLYKIVILLEPAMHENKEKVAVDVTLHLTYHHEINFSYSASLTTVPT